MPEIYNANNEQIMRTDHFIPSLIISLLVFVSCGKQEKDLIFTYSHFNATVSCISMPHGQDSVYYAGFENGNIVRVNFRTDGKTVISTDFANRIYDIIQEKDTLWLGIRNRGLVKCLLKNDSIKKTKDYNIKQGSTPELTTAYAPYAMEMDKNGDLFLGTSSGVYRLARNERDNNTLTTIYRPVGHKIKHFGVNQVEIYGDSLLGATESGLVLLDKHTTYQKGKTLINKKISHLYQMKDTLYASSEDMLYKIFKRPGGLSYDSIPFHKKHLFAHVVDTGEYHGKWIFTATDIKYSNDEGQISFSLPKRMDKNYRNYLCLGKDFLFFAQGMKVYSLALHQNPKGKSHHIIAAHTIDNTCYFISNDNYLYAYSNNPVSRLGFINGNLKSGENILQLCSSSANKLWFITDKMNLYSIDLTPSFLRKINPFKRTYEATLDPLSHDFKRNDFKSNDLTSIFYNDTCLYIGSRYVLYKIHHPENSKKRDKPDIKCPPGTENDLYVTDICYYNDSIFVSSLNHGLMKVNEDSLIIENKDLGNIYKMLVPKKLLLQTSEGIFYEDKALKFENPVKEKTKSIYTIYFQEKAGHTKCVYIGYAGIGTITIERDSIKKITELLNLDISFNKAAITDGVKTEPGTYLLGSPTGLYKFNVNDKALTNILIQEKSMRGLVITSIIIGFLLLILACFLYLQVDLERQVKYILNTIRKCRDDLRTVRKEDQEKLSATLNGLEKRIDDIRQLGMAKKIFGIRKYRIDVLELVKDVDAQTDIKEKRIKREDIIRLFNNHIETLINGLKHKEETEPCDSINSANELLKDLIEKIISLNNTFVAELKDKSDAEKTLIQTINEQTAYLVEEVEKYQIEDIGQKLEDIKPCDSINSANELLKDLIKEIISLNKTFVTELENKSDAEKTLLQVIQKQTADSIKKIERYEIEDIQPKLEDIKSENANSISADSSFDALKKLIKLILDMFDNFSEYIPAVSWTDQIKKDLNEIRDLSSEIKNLTPKKEMPETETNKRKAMINDLKDKSISFFKNNRKYLRTKTEWDDEKKIIACIYLSRESTKPVDIAEIFDDNTRKDRFSEIRGDIHSELDDLARSFLMNKLYDRTESQKKIKS